MKKKSLFHSFPQADKTNAKFTEKAHRNPKLYLPSDRKSKFASKKATGNPTNHT